MKIYIVEQADRSTGDCIFEVNSCFDNKPAATNALYNLVLENRKRLKADPNHCGFYFQISELELQSECNTNDEIKEIFKEEMALYLKGVKLPYENQVEIYYHMFDFDELEGAFIVDDITYEYKYYHGEIVIKRL
jgi:hypothetical protein